MPGKTAAHKNCKRSAVPELHELSRFFEIRRQRAGARAASHVISWRRQGDFRGSADTMFALSLPTVMRTFTVGARRSRCPTGTNLNTHSGVSR